jgi:TRAP-type C4-dicarboxylate transport system permease small subunit
MSAKLRRLKSRHLIEIRGLNMKKLVNALNKVVNFFTWFGIAALVVLMALIVVNIITRIFNYSIPGAYEIAQCLMVCIIWFGVGETVLKNAMIDVDIIQFPYIYRSIVLIISAIFCFIIGVSTVIQGNIARVMASASNILKIPKFPFQWVTALGFFLIILAIVVNMYRDRLPKKNSHSGTDSISEKGGGIGE